MLQKAYGESAMKKTSVYEWYKRFQDGREDVEDDERSGRPSTSTIDENVKKVEKMVLNDRRITIREVADEVGISIGSCHNIFSNVLGMKRVAAKFIPKLLNFDQKNNRMNIAQAPYSPDMAPCDFYLFPKLKRPMKGRRFSSIEEIKAESLRVLKDIPKSEYQECFEDWKKRWHKFFIPLSSNDKSDLCYFVTAMDEPSAINLNTVHDLNVYPRIIRNKFHGVYLSSLRYFNEKDFISTMDNSDMLQAQ
ncbi:uncharacterized protein [Prorops nasuta]|uniref:uncharacterized protein n=1 Tax=Prorops nasuta TaxID=863751 RepID=UPI0034CE268E